ESADPHAVAIEGEQRDDLGRRLHVEEPKSLGHDADHFGWTAIGDQPSSDDRGVAAEAPLPVGVSEKEHWGIGPAAGSARCDSTRCDICLREEAAELRFYSQCLQDLVGDE